MAFHQLVGFKGADIKQKEFIKGSKEVYIIFTLKPTFKQITYTRFHEPTSILIKQSISLSLWYMYLFKLASSSFNFPNYIPMFRFS